MIIISNDLLTIAAWRLKIYMELGTRFEGWKYDYQKEKTEFESTLKLKLTEIVISTEADRQIYKMVDVTNSSLRGYGESVADVRCFTPLRLVKRGCGKQAAHGHTTNRGSDQQY